MWEVKANTQFLGVLAVITLKFVRETIASKTRKSSVGSFSSTIICQGCLTEHRGDIRRRNCFNQSMVCLWSIGKKSPTMCLNPVRLLKCRINIGPNKLLTSFKASITLFIWTSFPSSSASAITSAPRTVLVVHLRPPYLFSEKAWLELTADALLGPVGLATFDPKKSPAWIHKDRTMIFNW